MDYHLREPFTTQLEQQRTMLAGGEYDFISIENADNEALSILDANRNYRGFHVIRDPRDIVVSGYFSHRYSHPVSADRLPWQWAHRLRLESLPDIEDGLLAEIEYCATYFERLRAWNYHHPRILECRYEEMIRDPLQAFGQIFAFLEIPLAHPGAVLAVGMAGGWLRHKLWGVCIQRFSRFPEPLLRVILWRNSFRRRSGGRRAGSEDTKHHYRKGIAGDWRNYFSPCVKDAFKACYPDLLITLGYEENNLW